MPVLRWVPMPHPRGNGCRPCLVQVTRAPGTDGHQKLLWFHSVPALHRALIPGRAPVSQEGADFHEGPSSWGGAGRGLQAWLLASLV